MNNSISIQLIKSDLVKNGLDLESRADNILKNMDCDLVVNPISYLVCAYELLGKDKRIKAKYETTLAKVRKVCSLTSIPAID